MAVFLLGGSRSFPLPSSAALASQCARSLVPWLSFPGARFVVGDQFGADFMLASVFAPHRPVDVYCVNGEPLFHNTPPANYIPWAGGERVIPFRARLMLRSKKAAAASGSGVFILNSADSKGSLATARFLNKDGKPVSALCVGFYGPPAPLDAVGSWELFTETDIFPVPMYTWVQQPLITGAIVSPV
jgi:hypothetical protein